MKEIKIAVPEQGEMLLVDISELHKELLKLPAGLYMDLYRAMSRKIDNSNFALNGLISANSCCTRNCL